jgi:pimeloyl-ACP methyl ester carboxylesterase
MRGFDRDLIREGHYGQRSCEPHRKAEHMAAPTKAAKCKSSLTTWGRPHMIALLTALDEERRGNAFDALVLYEPLLIDLLDLQDVAHAKAHAWDRAIIDNLNRQVRDGHQESGVRHFIESWNETNWEALPNTARQQLVANADNLALETVAVSKQKIDRSRLDTFVMPTLLVRGSCSPTLIALTTEIAASVIPNARQSIIPDCGHMGPLLKPAPIAVCIESFLHTLTAQSQQQEPR